MGPSMTGDLAACRCHASSCDERSPSALVAALGWPVVGAVTDAARRRAGRSRSGRGARAIVVSVVAVAGGGGGVGSERGRNLGFRAIGALGGRRLRCGVGSGGLPSVGLAAGQRTGGATRQKAKTDERDHERDDPTGGEPPLQLATIL